MKILFLLAILYPLISWGSQEKALFSEIEKSKIEKLSDPEFLLKKLKEEQLVKGRFFLGYAYNQEKKIARELQKKEFESGILNVLNRYAPPMDLSYIIKREVESGQRIK